MAGYAGKRCEKGLLISEFQRKTIVMVKGLNGFQFGLQSYE